MIFRTVRHVNGRCSDGRTYAAGEGTTSVISDDDPSMCALIRGWAAAGLVEILPAPEPEPETKTAVVSATADTKGPTRRARYKEDDK